MGNPARGRCPLDSRSGRCPDNPPGALPLDPAKGLRPSRHPLGYHVTGGILCGGHGARRARRDAEIAVRRCGGGEGSASADAGRGLCGHRRFAFDFRLRRTRHWRGIALCTPSPPCRLLQLETCYISGIFQNLHPEGCEGFQRATAKPFGRARRREIPAPPSPRCGAPVARRDPRKGIYPLHDTRMGVERAEGPSRDPRAAPLAGCQGSALTGSPEGSALWRGPGAKSPAG